MPENTSNEQALLVENTDLRARLAEAEEIIRAIRSGEVDALIVNNSAGSQVFTLQGVDAESNRVRGEMLALVGDAVIAVNEANRITYLNAAAEQLYGVRTMEVLGLSRDDVFETRWLHPEDEIIATKVLRETGYWRGENIHITHSGEAIHVESTISQLHAGKCARPGLIAVIRDITERARIAEKLRQAHHRLQTVLTSITDGLLVLDKNWRYTYFNEQGARMIGMRPEQLVGGCVWELFPQAKGTKFHECYHHALETGQTVHFEEYYPAPVDKWLNCHCYPTEEGLSVYFQDVTDRKRTEAALSETHLQLQSIINNTPAVVYAFDLEERFVMANTAVAQLLKSTPEQMIGKRRHEFMPREDADLHEVNDAAVIEAGRAIEFEEHNQLSGRSITWLTTKFPLRDAQGRIYAVAGISTDITLRKQAEEELVSSATRLRNLNDELESRVVERTAELQTAVNALETEIAERRLLEREVLRISDYEQSRIGRDLHDGTCQNLACIVVLADVGLREMNQEKQQAAANLKEISQIARQSIDEVRRLATGLFPVKIELHGLEWALRELAAGISARNNVDCSFIMPEPITCADNNAAVQIYRIAQEATSNAVRHGLAKNITIELSKTDGNFKLVVQDDGIGLSQGKKEGGLGMHTMSYRATTLGGSIEFSPTVPHGTTMICSFPEKG